MKKNSTPLKSFNFIYFRYLYSKVIRMMEKYEQGYMDVKFTLFDLTSDIEIEKTILTKLKEQTNIVAEKINNSPRDKVSNSKKLDNKLTRLRQSILSLEEKVDDQVKHLSPEFIDSEKKISKLIKSIMDDVDFMNNHIKHLDENLKAPLFQIVETHKKNGAILKEIEQQVKGYIQEINSLRTSINIDTEELRTKKAMDNMIILDKKISELHLLIYSNVDYAKFNFKYDTTPSKLLEFVRNNHGLFISEIKRHKLSDEQTRLIYVDSALTNFEEMITKFEREKMNQLNKHAPSGIHSLLMNIIRSYEEYINVVVKNVKDISEVNELTNEVNNIIAKMNTLLLQVEYNINSLDGIQKDYLERKKEKLQDKVSLLREAFKNNTKSIDSKSYQIVDRVMEKVENLTEASRGAAFINFFLKETIMFLNRFQGKNSDFDAMLQSVKNSFAEERYSESLRKAKELIEIYGIK